MFIRQILMQLQGILGGKMMAHHFMHIQPKYQALFRYMLFIMPVTPITIIALTPTQLQIIQVGLHKA